MTAKDIRRAIWLWISKPSAYNKSVGTTELLCLDLSQSEAVVDMVKSFFLQNSAVTDPVSYAAVKKSLTAHLTDRRLSVDEGFELEGNWCIVRFVIPKTGIFRLNSIDLVTCDFDSGIVDFHLMKNNGGMGFTKHYSISFGDSTVEFIPKNGESAELSRIENLLLSKFDKWSKNHLDNSKQSLCLVSHEDYYVLYNELKKKYCESIKKIWKESTDPDKFIHEDIAIATYLILLWGRKPVKFVDLGCGNGLLVHILASEGHQGHGVDVRSRKIWASYPPSTILKEETIVPSANFLFPEAEWIIGNHSDELTPWIPIISLLSSSNTNFFLLPCCAYEFSGVKYKRMNAGKSQYAEYLDFVQDICVECGFNVFRDRLKIPSTKRICLVSKGRSPLPINYMDKVVDIIGRRSCCLEEREPGKEWLPDFKARETVEKVRNCTQLDPNFVSLLLSKISDLLLVDTSLLTSTWNCGNPTEISSLAKRLDKGDLKHLKNECGGLQTFFRNHHFIFKISEGKVTFRKPEVKENRPKAWKVRPCWFYANHPQSCPLDDQSCSFIHDPNLKRSSSR